MSFPGFAALLALHSLPFSLGLMNFEFGMAIALWGAASWIAVRERSEPLRFAVHAVFVAGALRCSFFRARRLRGDTRRFGIA